MFPDCHSADTQFLSYLSILHPSQESHLENALLLWGEMGLGKISICSNEFIFFLDADLCRWKRTSGVFVNV